MCGEHTGTNHTAMINQNLTGFRRSRGTENVPLIEGDTITAGESSAMPRPRQISSRTSSGEPSLGKKWQTRKQKKRY